MKEESLLLLSDLQKLINQVVLIDYTIIILGGAYMEKKCEQELSVLEVLRLHREFHLPHPVPADEQEKPLDKVKEPPRACRSREREER